MNITTVDWCIVGLFFVFLTFSGFVCKYLIKSTSDWMVAGRKMRKFLGLSSNTAESVGLVTFVLASEAGFTSGFSYVWFGLINLFVVVVIFGGTGFVINRFRETKVVTVAEYTQTRYSKGVRIATGLILGLSGVLNLAIFPILSSQFLTHFFGAPEYLKFMGVTLPFVPTIMAILIGLAIFFTYIGGMVAVLVTDYVQSIIIAIALFGITYLVIDDIGFVDLHQTLRSNFGAGSVNPLISESFGPVFLIWQFLLSIIIFPSFAVTMQRLASTESAKTARQWTFWMGVFSQGRNMMVIFIGIAALAVLGSQSPEGMDSGLYPKVVGAIYLNQLIPPIFLGVVIAGLLSAFISTVDSYLLSWSTVLINDVVYPIYGKEVSPKAHLWLLRIMVALMGIFLYIFGVFYKPTERVFEFFMLTGTMMIGSGMILIGGLYWKRGSNVGAYAAVILCGILPLFDLVLKRVETLDYNISPQTVGLSTIFIGIFTYVILSILFPNKSPLSTEAKSI